MSLWDAVAALPPHQIAFFLIALIVAFGFEFINGFHDTANAVTTVIYTRSLKPTPAVIYSGLLNFLGVLLGGTTVAFGIVNLLPVDLLVDAGHSAAALVMVLSLLLSGVIWNLGTWYLGLPVSSSHTLIGSILGVGIANSLLAGRGISGVNWTKAGEVGIGLLISPIIGFVAAYLLLLVMKKLVKEPRLYVPPQGDDRPPSWVRVVLIGTCGGVSFAHGSNDGQKGMGLLLLVLIGFLPAHYALNRNDDQLPENVRTAVSDIRTTLREDGSLTPEADARATELLTVLGDVSAIDDIPPADRWLVRRGIFQFGKEVEKANPSPAAKERLVEPRKAIGKSIEFVPLWVVIGTALALGIGTTIGYKRIVLTVAEKIGKTHLTYAQGAAAELVAATTIFGADMFHLPVSTTQVVSSGVAGTMAANGSGVQGATCQKILLAWVCTLPCTVLLAGGLFALGRLFVG